MYEVLVLGAAYFANSVLPILSKRAHTDNQGFTKAFVKGYVILFFLGIFVAVMNLIFAPLYRDWETDRKSTRLNSSHITRSRMPSSA